MKGIGPCHRRGHYRDGLAVVAVRKARYSTREKADQAAARKGQEVYHCPQCMGWHLRSKR